MKYPVLDHTDFEIIRILQKNAWTPNKQIAAAVRLAPSTCHERIRHLRASGVIRGAHAEIEPRAIGVALDALAFIKLAKYERTAINRFLSEMESIPEVQSVFMVNGRHDVILHISVKDIDHLRDLGLDRITSQPMVVSIETSIVYDGRTRRELPILLDSAQPRGAATKRRRSPSAKRPQH
jgi:DNA-binding Lrp family transcriptional regulator